MNKKNLVSVIIPVYNVEKYVADTLSCVMRQTYRNIEIIVVDDGSTDGTSDIIKDLANKDSRIQYYRREKRNAGVQRNFGFHKSVGEYIVFLDGDDLFDTNLIKHMIEKIKSDSSDICICNADQYDTEKDEYIEKPQYLRTKLLPDIIPFSAEEIGKGILYFTSLVPWNKMFDRTFIEKNNLHFQDIIRANDQYFSVLSLVLAERITIVEETLVHYRVKREGNLTTQFSDTPMCSYEALLKTKTRLEEIGLMTNENIRCSFDNKALNIMLFSLNIQRTLDGYKQLYNTLRQGGFQRLGIELKEKDYYFDPLEYENLKNILKMSYDEFLVMKNREYRDVIANYRVIVSKKNKRIANYQEREQEWNQIQKKFWYRAIRKMKRTYRSIFGKDR